LTDAADVVVIGAGCTGTSIAWQLAARGAGRVVLIDRQAIAAGATGRSSAIVRMHYVHEVLVRLALRSRQVFENFSAIVGAESGFRRVGFLAIYGPDDVHSLEANVAMQRRIGVDAQLLDAVGVLEVEPRLVADDIGAAAWEPDSGYADPVLTAQGFASAAEQLGVERRLGISVLALETGAHGVESVVTSGGRIATRSVVVAAGYRSAALLQPLDIDLPVTPVRHAIAIVERSADFGSVHPVVADRITTSYYRPEGARLTLLGFSPPFDGEVDAEVERDRLPSDAETHVLVERFCRRFPSQEVAVLRRGYTGVYDVTPDLQPYLGPIDEIPGLHVAFGFSGHGFKLSPAVGELIAENIVTGQTSLVDIKFFRPSRIAENRPIVAEHTYSVVTLG
jgi:sarcosine oxidase, subunit beta